MLYIQLLHLVSLAECELPVSNAPLGDILCDLKLFSLFLSDTRGQRDHNPCLSGCLFLVLNHH